MKFTKLEAKSGKPLARYFPEMAETLKRVPARSFVLDGELAIVSGGEFSFEALLQRIHPAESRIKRLAAETPAIFILFDLLLDASEDRAVLTAKLEALIASPGFTGKAPGGQSRWSTERSEQWQPLKPKLVVEVSYDQVTGNRFRHGTKLVRFRPDKRPSQCTFEQIEPAAKPAKLIAGMLKS
jgi:ATP-dependent DNA ligase